MKRGGPTLASPSKRDRETTTYYTMKTSRSPAVSSHSRGHGHQHTMANSSHTGSRNSRTSTPMSPRMPHSVGQSHAPKSSPGSSSRHGAQPQSARPSSPNYFGLSVEQGGNDSRESSTMVRNNWSPPTSSVKSFGTAMPQQMPLDANPEFEAFRRAADMNRGGGSFALGSSYFPRPPVPATPQPTSSATSSRKRPAPPRWHTHGSDVMSSTSIPQAPLQPAPITRIQEGREFAPRLDAESDSNSMHDSAYASGESKRNSQASSNPPSVLNMPRYESPVQSDSPFESRTTLSKNEDRHPRLSLMQGRANQMGSDTRAGRAATIPAKLEAGTPQLLAPAALKEILEQPGARVLVLDVRVATQYAQSRIKGALSLCIPTTLLKRATFDLKKVQSTFQSDKDQSKFATWRDAKYLVVYDASSTDKRDAVAAMNMLKKFANEGYTGQACILRGGFNQFATAYPQLVDHRSGSEISGSPPSLSLGAGAKGRPIIPVLGGVPLPMASANPNPFFSNIRQNMDLADGVGRMDLKLPMGIDSTALPAWLRVAATPDDRGQEVSNKFLKIEKTEQSRMREAYSVKIGPGGQTPQREDQVQLSGIEKGGKNRYKDILPFDHARVKLEGRTPGECDYVNASHIKASRSHKRYIASQGPLPATYEDFWSVIWDQDVRVIVMLTAESEGGQLKCHPYWSGKDFGQLRLRPLSEKKVSLEIDKHRSSSTASSIASGSHGPSAETGRRRANTTTTTTPGPKPSAPGFFQQASSSSSGSASVASDTPFVIIRKFALSHDAHPFAPIREITQLHYPSWPDFGAPAQPSQLLALVELANVMHRAALPTDAASGIAPHHASSTGPSRSQSRLDSMPLNWHDEPEPGHNPRPMLVHCSAGCGRTGTFCTVDSVIDMLKRQRLWAVGRANAVIEAKTGGSRMILDADGDTSMETESPISPFSGSKEQEMFPPMRRSIDSGRSDESDIDTTWLEGDTVDLISATVEDFRKQRLSMVQSLRQFVLCYETIIEWVWRLQDRGSAQRARARSGSLGGYREQPRPGTYPRHNQEME